MYTVFGQQALLSMIVHLSFIAITWWALQALNFDKLLRSNKILQARILYVLLTIAIGSAVSNFFLDYIGFANKLPYMFGE